MRGAGIASAGSIDALARPPLSPWRDFWLRFLHSRRGVAALFTLALIGLIAVFAPVLAPEDPLAIHAGKAFLPPMWETDGPTGRAGEPQFVLGTDALGRDVLSRVMHGARVSLTVGLVPAIAMLAIGVGVGLLAGFAGGPIDNLTMRVGDILYAFPDLLFFIIAMTALRDLPAGQWLNGVVVLCIAMALVNWITLARIVRAQVLSLRTREFVQASVSIGASRRQIMGRHILPNCLGSIITYTALRIPSFIILEAILGYLGLGLRLSTDPRDIFLTSWGYLLVEGQTALYAQPWILLAPALALLITTWAFNALADSLSDAL